MLIRVSHPLAVELSLMDSNHTLPVDSLLAALTPALSEGKISPATYTSVTHWLTAPEYAAFVPEIATAIERSAWTELEAAFWEVIPFGTGGRRGAMGAYGTATINRRTIAESAQGLAAYTRQATGKEHPRAVVACDTRLRSAEFSRLTATTLVANGFEVFLFEGPRSTPELSFAVRHLGCDAGVMISASHNPPSDNGFKAYWSHGGQVLPPHDTGITAAVFNVKEIRATTIEEAFHSGRLSIVGEEVDLPYLESVVTLSLSRARGIRVLFTPLHGVGETNVFRVLQAAGFSGVDIFGPQRQADGEFTNVPDQAPNPERHAVFGPVIAAATAETDLILASDPDADRLGVVARGADGTWTCLNGNQVAALLADYVLRKRTENHSISPEHYLVETFVTTPILARIAAAFGVQIVNDLPVGFKYIGQVIEDRGADRFLLGCEESLGYLAGGYARDKDAAIAALYIAELAAELKTSGLTLCDQLDQLALKYGLHWETLHTETCQGARGQEQIASIMRRLRESPPASLGEIALIQVADYAAHEFRSLPANQRLAELPQPRGNILRLIGTAAGFDVTVTIRPSGTEPKLKFYFAACQPAITAPELPVRKVAIRECLADFQRELVTWIHDVLNPP